MGKGDDARRYDGGVSTYIQRLATWLDLTPDGNHNNSNWIFSMWFYRERNDALNETLFSTQEASDNVVGSHSLIVGDILDTVTRSTDPGIQSFIRFTDATLQTTMKWHHFIMGYDRFNSANTEILLNGVRIPNATWDIDIQGGDIQRFYEGVEWYIGRNVAQNKNSFLGSLSEVWFDNRKFSIEPNISLWRDPVSGKPADLSENGAIPGTGTTPPLFYSPKGDHINKGRGGAWTVVGTLTVPNTAPAWDVFTGSGGIIIGGAAAIEISLSEYNIFGAGTIIIAGAATAFIDVFIIIGAGSIDVNGSAVVKKFLIVTSLKNKSMTVDGANFAAKQFGLMVLKSPKQIMAEMDVELLNKGARDGMVSQGDRLGELTLDIPVLVQGFEDNEEEESARVNLQRKLMNIKRELRKGLQFIEFDRDNFEMPDDLKIGYYARLKGNLNQIPNGSINSEFKISLTVPSGIANGINGFTQSDDITQINQLVSIPKQTIGNEIVEGNNPTKPIFIITNLSSGNVSIISLHNINRNENITWAGIIQPGQKLKIDSQRRHIELWDGVNWINSIDGIADIHDFPLLEDNIENKFKLDSDLSGILVLDTEWESEFV